MEIESNNQQYQSFIDEIIASPRDEAARLVFADYLEEVGDPRAELIRIQFELGDLAPFDKRRQKLRTRERRVARQHGWFTSVPKEAIVRDTYGGFIDSVEMTVTRFLKHHEALFSSSPIRKVALKGKSVKFQKLAEVENLQRLAQLQMFSNDVEASAYCDLVRSPYLQDLEALKISCRRSHFELMHCIGKDEPFEALKHLELHGYGTEANERAAVELAGSEKMQSLLSLSLSSQFDSSIRLLTNSANLQNVNTLHMAGRFSDKSVRAIQTGLQNLTSLSVQTYMHNSADAFNVSGPLPDLKFLVVGSDMPNSAVENIVSRYPNLKTLDLAQNQVNDKGAQVLAESPVLKSLERLVLTGNRLTLKGVRTLVDSPHWHDDLNLYLTSNQLTGLQMQALRKEFGSKFGNFGDIRWMLKAGR